MTGWGWGWMALGWVLLLSVIVLVVRGVGRGLSGTPREREAHQILAERFARWELSPEEFTELRAALRRAYRRWARPFDLDDQALDRIPHKMREEFQRHPARRSAEPSPAPRDQQVGSARPVRCVLGSYRRVLDRERKTAWISKCKLFGGRPI